MKRGDIVKCIEAPDWLERNISVGQEYVVCKIVRAHNATYYRILGDDGRGVDLHHRLFSRAA